MSFNTTSQSLAPGQGLAQGWSAERFLQNEGISFTSNQVQEVEKYALEILGSDRGHEFSNDELYALAIAREIVFYGMPKDEIKTFQQIIDFDKSPETTKIGFIQNNNVKN